MIGSGAGVFATYGLADRVLPAAAGRRNAKTNCRCHSNTFGRVVMEPRPGWPRLREFLPDVPLCSFLTRIRSALSGMWYAI